MIIGIIKNTPPSLIQIKNGLITTAKYFACLTDNLVFKPARIATNTAVTSITTIGTTQLTALESICMTPLLWYGKDATIHSSECGVASLLHTALQGDFSTRLIQKHWNESSWSDWTTLAHWNALYDALTDSTTSSSPLHKLFIAPFQKGVCKDFKADMLVLGPFALLMLASLTTRVSTSILKSTCSDICAQYRKQPTPPSIQELKAPIRLIPQKILLEEIALALEQKHNCPLIIKN
jgi:hypothetical protein